MNAADGNRAQLATLDEAAWTAEAATTSRPAALIAIENGDVLFLPRLRFDVTPAERALFSPAIAGSAKNVAFDPASGRLGGTVAADEARRTLTDMLSRFSASAASLVHGLLPHYRSRVITRRTSFRPVEIAGRATSWRKDDTRLHIDSFPATPSHGHRILRVFANVNPDGRARTWRIGERFERVAARFAPSLRLPLPGTGRVLSWLRVTKTPRPPYDAMMLQLHDRMKADAEYQASCPQATIEFPAGTTWMAFTDQVSHAAMAGQYQLEQTFLLPVEAMQDESRSPLRVLEKLKGRRLA